MGNIIVVDFISRMDLAYALADVVISRAGAGAISELCIVGKPVLFIPSPNLAEDHQTKNALKIVENNAAVMVKEKDLNEKFFDVFTKIMKDSDFSTKLSKSIKL